MDPELETLEGSPDEQAGFDDDDDHPTERPDADDTPSDEPRGGQPEPEVEYAQLTKAEYEELRARAALIDEIRATQDKSFGTFGRTIKGLQDQLAQFQAGAQIDISQEDIDALKEDWPPMAAALQKVRDLRALPAGGLDPTKIDELVQQRLAPALETINTRVDQAVEMRLLSKAHPDWSTYTKSQDFAAYTATLPATEQAQLADSWDSDFIGRHIAAAKARAKRVQPTTTTTSTARTSRISAAVTPRGTGATRPLVGNDERAGFDAA